MQYDAAHELYVEMPLAERAARRLAHGGEGVMQDVVQALAAAQATAQPVGAGTQLVVRQLPQLRLRRI